MIKTVKSFFTAILLILLIFVITHLIFQGIFPRKYESAVEQYCSKYSVDTSLVYALIKAESNFRENAQSHAGAKGLMQITDDTFKYCIEELNIPGGNIFDAETNIHCGIWYLSYLLDKYDGNTKNAIAAYNAGETNVDGWLSNPEHSKDGKTLEKIPFGETRRHVIKIEKYMKIYELIYF